MMTGAGAGRGSFWACRDAAMRRAMSMAGHSSRHAGGRWHQKPFATIAVGESAERKTVFDRKEQGHSSRLTLCVLRRNKRGRRATEFRSVRHAMSLEICRLLARRSHQNFELHEKYVNPKLVRLLKTIGFDRHYTRGSGAYLYDDAGEQYLDLLAGFGVYALGRNHPAIKNAVTEMLSLDLPDLVQLDASVLAGPLAGHLILRVPQQDRGFFFNSGTEAVQDE